jgi:hypothetical protein
VRKFVLILSRFSRTQIHVGKTGTGFHVERLGLAFKFGFKFSAGGSVSVMYYLKHE